MAKTLEELARESELIIIDNSIITQDKDYGHHRSFNNTCFAEKVGSTERYNQKDKVFQRRQKIKIRTDFSDIPKKYLDRQEAHVRRLIDTVKRNRNIHIIPETLVEYNSLLDHLDNVIEFRTTGGNRHYSEKQFRDIYKTHLEIYRTLKKRELDIPEAEQLTLFLMNYVEGMPFHTRLNPKRKTELKISLSDAKIFTNALYSRGEIVTNDLDIANLANIYSRDKNTSIREELLPEQERIVGVYFPHITKWTNGLGIHLMANTEGYISSN